MSIPSLCSAEGWFAEYESDVVRRVTCFMAEGGSYVVAYVVADDGALRRASAIKGYLTIWHVKDER